MKKSSIKKAENAVIVGDVSLAEDVNIWHNTIIRGDLAPICIGRETNIQDNVIIHVTKDIPVRIGSRVTVGHGAILHSCTVLDNALIGMGAIVLDGAIIGEGAMIGAGALVSPNKIIPPRSLVVGIPGKVIRELTAEELKANQENVKEYLELSMSLPSIKEQP